MAEPTEPKVILVGGTSHVGKSTVAEALAQARTATLISTDGLSRHPGRPWRATEVVPEDVMAYYSQAQDDADRQRFFLDDVWRHYTRRVWPIVAAIMACRLDNPYDRPTVIEGSAIVPVIEPADGMRVYYLTLDDEVIVERIRADSRYADHEPPERLVIDTFSRRTLDFQARVTNEADARDLVEVAAFASADEIVDYLLTDATKGS